MPGVFHRLLGLLGSLKITVLGLFLLMVLTIWGTLYQAEHGLYSAQERFYQSWSFPLAGPIPFPGAQTVMLLLFINLAASLAFMALTRRLRVGFIATHAGLALMLAAGGVTFYFGRSANLSLAEGEAANVALSSQEWELAMMPANSGPQRVVSALDARQLRPGRRIPLPGTEFALHIDSYHRNCIASRAATANAPVNGAGHTTLVRKPPAGEPGEDRPGMIATLEERGKERGRILLWGGDPTPTALPGDRETMVIGLRRLHMPLPATIRLLDFRRELHPGTGMARSYSSQVSVEGSTESARKVLISMNKPLRIGGYTFYQSSFASGPGGSEVSTLAVVRNQARLLPYYATGLTGLGMLIHFTGLLLIRLRQPTRETPS